VSEASGTDPSADEDTDALAARSPDTPGEVLEALAGRRPDLRATVVLNASAPARLLTRLAFEGDADVHAALRRRARPDADEDEEGAPLRSTGWAFASWAAPSPAVPTAQTVTRKHPLLPDPLAAPVLDPARMTAPQWTHRREAGTPWTLSIPAPPGARPRAAHRHPHTRRAARAVAGIAVATLAVGAGLVAPAGRTAASAGGQIAPSTAWVHGAHQAWTRPGHTLTGYVGVSVSDAGTRIAAYWIGEDGAATIET